MSRRIVINPNRYPSCWPKVSRLIRALAAGRCEQCHKRSKGLSVHHKGVPFATGRPGNKHDKHDIRRENLVALCPQCHDLEDDGACSGLRKRDFKRREKRRQHARLGVGTGLVVVQSEVQA